MYNIFSFRLLSTCNIRRPKILYMRVIHVKKIIMCEQLVNVNVVIIYTNKDAHVMKYMVQFTLT